MGLLSSLLGNAGAIENSVIQEKYGKLLIDSEEVIAGFKIIRDTFIFTNKRLIIVLIRTFLSLSIELEIEGRFPWQRKEKENRLDQEA